MTTDPAIAVPKPGTGTETSGPAVAVLLLTKNGERYLDEVLAGVYAQRTRWAFEVVAVDSGSSDATLAILHRFGVRLVQIPPREFQHGRTRNLAAALTTPSVRFLVYLTQDATPLPGWLDALVATVAAEDDVAGAYSRQVPRPGANPLVARRMVEEWPAVGGTARLVKRLDPAAPPTSPGALHALAHFANTSSCLRRDVWARLPFPEVAFAEDVAWGLAALRSGYTLVYEPASMVLHAHSGSLWHQFRENVDHGRAVRHVLATADVPGSGGAARRLMPPRHDWATRVLHDLIAIWRSDRRPLARLWWTAYAPLWYAASLGGQWVGARRPAWRPPRRRRPWRWPSGWTRRP